MPGKIITTKKLELPNGTEITVESDGTYTKLSIDFPSPDVRSGITPQTPVRINFETREWERLVT